MKRLPQTALPRGVSVCPGVCLSQVGGWSEQGRVCLSVMDGMRSVCLSIRGGRKSVQGEGDVYFPQLGECQSIRGWIYLPVTG